MTALLPALVALLTTPLLARVARRWGFVDRREGQEQRKPRTAPVPPVGGLALLLALLAGALFEGRFDGQPWLALLAALVLGTLDDRLAGGLGPAAKLAGQLGVAALLAFAWPAPGAQPWVLLGLGMVAMNAVNTWDNADGAAGGLALVGFGLGPMGGAAAGFLPWNLARRRSDGVPHAYLGDAGSHVIGVALAANPGAWWVLLLPLLDLARLAWVRTRAGSRPWIGDRRHLAHRLEAAGIGPLGVAGLLAVLAGVPLLGAQLWGPAGGWIGVGLTSLGFGFVVRCTSDPCPSGGPSG